MSYEPANTKYSLEEELIQQNQHHNPKHIQFADEQTHSHKSPFSSLFQSKNEGIPISQNSFSRNIGSPPAYKTFNDFSTNQPKSEVHFSPAETTIEYTPLRDRRNSNNYKSTRAKFNTRSKSKNRKSVEKKREREFLTSSKNTRKNTQRMEITPEHNKDTHNLYNRRRSAYAERHKTKATPSKTTTFRESNTPSANTLKKSQSKNIKCLKLSGQNKRKTHSRNHSPFHTYQNIQSPKNKIEDELFYYKHRVIQLKKNEESLINELIGQQKIAKEALESLQDMNKKIEELRSQLEQQKKISQNQLESLKKEIISQYEQRLESKRRKDQEKYEIKLKAMQNFTDDLKKKMDGVALCFSSNSSDKENVISELRSHIGSLEINLQDVTKKYSHLEDKWKRMHQSFSSQNQLYQSNIQQLKQQLKSAYTDQNKSNDKESTKYSQQLNKINHEIDLYKNQISQLKENYVSQLQKKDQNNVDLQCTVTEQKNEIIQLKEILREKNEKIIRLESILDNTSSAEIKHSLKMHHNRRTNPLEEHTDALNEPKQHSNLAYLKIQSETKIPKYNYEDELIADAIEPKELTYELPQDKNNDFKENYHTNESPMTFNERRQASITKIQEDNEKMNFYTNGYISALKKKDNEIKILWDLLKIMNEGSYDQLTKEELAHKIEKQFAKMKSQ